MGILERSIAYIQNRFPEVDSIDVSDGVVFQGRFLIEAQHDNYIVHTAPLLKLFIPNDYPLRLPSVNDVDDVIIYDHKFTNGNLCVSTIFDLQLKLRNSKCISDYIDGFLVPYFISYEYWKETGKDIFGDREHATAGVFESIQEFLCIKKDFFSLFKSLIGWASKSKKFRRSIPKSEQLMFLRKYSAKIAVLRSLGILRLKAIYKLIDLCEKTPIDKEKNINKIMRLHNIACS